jgi:hypothetical protein
MAAPTTYSEWTILLDKFGEGDDTALELLNKGSFTVDAGTASRFYLRIEEVYKKRKQNWLDKFQRSFYLQSFKTEDDFEIALRNGKQNLISIGKFVDLKGLPEDLRKILKKDLEDFVAEVKRSLRENVSKISNGREKMLLLLNTFGLKEITEEAKSENKNNGANTNEITPAIGRKIIF